MRTIINLSDIALTAQFRAQGVYDLPTNDKYRLKELLDMSSCAVTPDEILARSEQIAQLARTTGAQKAMVFANNFMTFSIEMCLRYFDITPLYPRGIVKGYCEYSDAHQKIIVKKKFYLTELIETPNTNQVLEYLKFGNVI